MKMAVVSLHNYVLNYNIVVFDAVITLLQRDIFAPTGTTIETLWIISMTNEYGACHIIKYLSSNLYVHILVATVFNDGFVKIACDSIQEYVIDITVCGIAWPWSKVGEVCTQGDNKWKCVTNFIWQMDWVPAISANNSVSNTYAVWFGGFRASAMVVFINQMQCGIHCSAI